MQWVRKSGRAGPLNLHVSDFRSPLGRLFEAISTFLEVIKGLLELLSRVEHEGSIVSDRLVQGLPCKEKDSSVLLLCLNLDQASLVGSLKLCSFNSLQLFGVLDLGGTLVAQRNSVPASRYFMAVYRSRFRKDEVNKVGGSARHDGALHIKYIS